MNKTKEMYLKRINKLLKECEDYELIDLIWQLLCKCSKKGGVINE